MIARLEVTRGPLTEYPLAEKTRGGWQNGVTFYPDAEVTKVTPLHVVPAEPQGEPSDDYEAGYAEGFHHGLSTPRGSARDDRVDGEPSDARRVLLAECDKADADMRKWVRVPVTFVRAALRAAGEVRP